MATNYEKYLAGVPLNEELAALKAGRLTEYEMNQATAFDPSVGNAQVEDPERPLSKDERLALREMRLSPGWPVLQKLLKRATLAHKKAAISISEDDPLAAGSQLTNAWLQVKGFKQLVAELNWSIVVELESIEEGAHGRQHKTGEIG